MAFLMAEGFESYASNAEAAATPRWTVTSVELWGAGFQRTGSHAVRSLAGYKDLGADESAKVFVGGSVYNQGGNTISMIALRGIGGTVDHLTLRSTSDGRIAVHNGAGAMLAQTGTGEMPVLAHTYWELEAFIDDAAGYAKVYKNGSDTPIINFSGDTRNGGADALVDRIAVVGTSTNLWWDDIYMTTDSGSAPHNGRLYDVRCWPLAPNGNGNYSQLTGSDGNNTDNYLLVDEHAGQTNGADWVGSAIDGEKDTYAYANLVPTTGTVVGVYQSSHHVKSDAGAKSARHVLRTSATDYTSSDFTLGTSMGRNETLWLTNPNTATPWSISEVNATELGFEARP